MAYLNNIYGNACYTGFLAGMLAGRNITNATAASYLGICTAAKALAVDVDALIAFDALVTTGAGITQLAITTNTIAADEQWRAGMLHDICMATSWGQFQDDAAVAGAQTTRAAAIHAAWVEGLTLLVTP